MELKKALGELRKNKEKKFDQSLDLIVNLKGVDLKRANIVSVLTMPHKIKDKKVCGFLEGKSELVRGINEASFKKYKDKNELRKLVKEFDFFIANAKLMPKVATTFGKALGPIGKMPSPQLGILPQENEGDVKAILEKISKAVKIRAKEPSIKIVVGKISMDDEKIIENVKAIFGGIVNLLPTKKENVKNVLLKLTMSKPIKVEI